MDCWNRRVRQDGPLGVNFLKGRLRDNSRAPDWMFLPNSVQTLSESFQMATNVFSGAKNQLLNKESKDILAK